MIPATFPSKADRLDYFRTHLKSNPKWAINALLVIYRYQTSEEKVCLATHNENGVGFTAFDAEILTSFAQRVLSEKALTEKQMRVLFKRMGKYAGQIIAHMGDKAPKIEKPLVYAVA